MPEVFNMGIGMAIVTAPANADEVIRQNARESASEPSRKGRERSGFSF